MPHGGRPDRMRRNLTVTARLAGMLALALFISACAQRAPLTDQLTQGAATPPPVELTDVPFHPQRRYQCGPAALATVLAYAGHPVDPDQLRDRVYVPARRGSLQPEMRAAARDHGLLPVAHPADLLTLAETLDQGHPILVMQNLGFERLPVWHYAVVVGIDVRADEVILRSGTRERETLSLRRFERSWARADHWAITLHPADILPAHATERSWLAAAAPFEQTGALDIAETAYSTAAGRWPERFHVQMGLGNVRYQAGAFSDAEAAFRRAIALDPDHPAGWHNLAWALIRQERLAEAEAPARRAATLAATRQHAHANTYDGALNALNTD